MRNSASIESINKSFWKSKLTRPPHTMFKVAITDNRGASHDAKMLLALDIALRPSSLVISMDAVQIISWTIVK
ncbi:hypothetical protein QL285_073091 [Trifolium repens]|nr:hypothetical protein QL285_073091 [Trifolium repens]